MNVTTKLHRLAARWNAKDRDLYTNCTPRFTDGDLRYLCEVLNNEVLCELEKRGYDLKTLVFHIDKTPEAIAEHERRKMAVTGVGAKGG